MEPSVPSVLEFNYDPFDMKVIFGDAEQYDGRIRGREGSIESRIKARCASRQRHSAVTIDRTQLDTDFSQILLSRKSH